MMMIHLRVIFSQCLDKLLISLFVFSFKVEKRSDFSSLNQNGIVTVNNGVVTVMNSSGIFMIPVEQFNGNG